MHRLGKNFSVKIFADIYLLPYIKAILRKYVEFYLVISDAVIVIAIAIETINRLRQR